MRRKKKILASTLGALGGTVLALALAGGGVQAETGKKTDCRQMASHEVTELFFENVHTAVWDQIRRSQ